jgi:hypothetical protein
MNSFWDKFYDPAKDKRYGTLAFFSLLAVIGLVALLGWIFSMTGPADFQEIVLPALAGLAILVVVLGWRGIRRAQKQRQEFLKCARLSRDEMAKARSKLGSKMIRPMRPVRRPPPRAPDIDLKY